MWNIGFGELAIICIVLIIAVGPERLPSMMKTVGKTVRTLRQASRDLRESTGIDELLREDFDYHPPPRRPAPVATVAREPEPVAVMNPDASPMAPVSATADPAVVAASEAMAATSLPSDGPLTAPAAEPLPAAAVPVEPAAALPLDHANVGATLPSDAPLAAKAPALSVPPPAGPSSLPPPPPASADDSKQRES